MAFTAEDGFRKAEVAEQDGVGGIRHRKKLGGGRGESVGANAANARFFGDFPAFGTLKSALGRSAWMWHWRWQSSKRSLHTFDHLRKAKGSTSVRARLT
jgi:hypothetical protein